MLHCLHLKALIDKTDNNEIYNQHVMKKLLVMLMSMVLSTIIFSGCEPDEPVTPATPPSVPTISTEEVKNIKLTSVTVVCIINDDGGSEISEAGICWANDTVTPTIYGFKKMVYVKKDAFDVELSVSPSRTYTVRAYAKNDVGVAYGRSITFTTQDLPPPEPILPQVTTGVMLSRTSNSAIITGTVVDSGYCRIIEAGICWSKDGDPNISDHLQTTEPELGEFTASIRGLTTLTDYKARAYVTNQVGTVYGDIISFCTFDSVVDADGNVYYGVKIGDQVWLTENLKTTHFNNGDAIPYAPDDAQWSSMSGPAYCWYDNDESRAQTSFGALYNWWVASDPRGVAPEGYHIPTVEDCHKFGQYFGLNQIFYINGTDEVHYYVYNGGKSIRTNYAWIYPCYGTNSTGFTCLPTGFRFSDGDYCSRNYYASFWSITAYDDTSAWRVSTGNESGSDGIIMQGKWIYKVYGFGLRCVKD